MKVLLFNGSPHKEGCTYTALSEVASSLNSNEVETEIFWVGTKPVSGCLGCGACLKTKRCIMDDRVNEFLSKVENTDGFILGAPVHYASAAGAAVSFMDRVFFGKGAIFYGKPAAAVVSCRRGGATASLDRLNKYFTINCMPVVSSQYWNMVHGNTPEEVARDLEGLQIMRTLGNNMAWLLKCIKAGRDAGIDFPEMERRISTNFIR